MKKIYFFIILLMVSCRLVGQDKNQLNEYIISSIESYIEWYNDLVKRGISSVDTSNYYVCMDGFPANFPYSRLQNVTFFTVKFFQMRSNPLKKQLKKGMVALFMSFEIKNNQLQIIVSDRTVKLIDKNTISLAIRDCKIYTYEYSCRNEKWELKDTSI